jgi:probable rRNA maturation factor
MSHQPSPKQNPPESPAAWFDHTATLTPAELHWLQSHTLAALNHLLVPQASTVRIAVVADAEMTATHARCMGINETTDVLTFDLRDTPDTTSPLDTDVMLCLDEAKRRVTERSPSLPSADPAHELRRELLLYALHGILHCLNHDDHTDDDYTRMHTAEDEILKAIGVGPVFNPGPEPTAS